MRPKAGMIALTLLLTPVVWLGLTAYATAGGGTGAVIVDFQDHEPGLDPYRTRMIVTSRFMRIDDGTITPDFVLFDRRAHVIYSTSSMDQRTLVVRGDGKKYPLPSHLVTQVVRGKEKLPKVSGHTVIHRTLLVNGKTCYDFYSAAGLLPRVVQALKEFQRVLASEHGDALQHTIAGATTECDQVNNVYRPTTFLNYGFPVRATNSVNRTRQLVNYHEVRKVDAAWFALPKGYTEFTARSMRGE